MTALTFFLLLFLAAVLCLTAEGLHARARLDRGLSYRRRFSTGSVYAGGSVQLEETLENRKSTPVPWALTETTLPGRLTLSAGTAGDRHDRFLRAAVYLPRQKTIHRETTLYCPHRGCFHLGATKMTVRDLFGFVRRSRSFPAGEALYVYPALLPQPRIPACLLQFQGDVAARRWILPDPILVSGIREYQPGDPLRDVHWNATARTGEVQVKVRDFTVSPKVLLVINAASRPGLWGPMEPEDQELVEPLLEVAATLLDWTVRNGLEAGLCANTAAEPGMEHLFLFCPPQGGEACHQELLRALARMELQCRVSFPTLLDQLCSLGVRGMDLAVLSRYVTPEISGGLERLRRQDNTVTLLWSEEGGVMDAAQ